MAIEKGACLAGGACGRVNEYGGGGGVGGGCGSNMIIGQEGMAVCTEVGVGG